MATELFPDVTFFNGIIDDTQLQDTEKTTAPVEKRRKSNKPSTGTGRGTRKSKTPEKENQKTAKRGSKKAERQPLATLNLDRNVSKKPSPSPKKRTGRVTRSLGPEKEKEKALKKTRQSVPKIIVHHDSPAKDKEQKKERKSVRLSKSLDGSNPKGRASSESPGTGKKAWRSFNDLTNAKSVNQNEKDTKTGGKTTKTSPRQKSLKPGNPEFDDLFKKLEGFFPNVDPELLMSLFTKTKGSISQTVEFIINKEKTNELPTRDDYVRRNEVENVLKKFLENFSIANYLKMIPDPWQYFLQTEKHNCSSYLAHSLHYLKNKYKKHYSKAINDALKKHGNSLYLADKELKKKNPLMKMRATNRSKNECDAGKPTTVSVQFVHEVAFIENESKIKSYIKKAQSARHKKFKNAEMAGTLLKCQSCNDSSLLPDDVVNCPANHVFCKNCVVKHVGIDVEKNNFQFKCLMNCKERFSTESLEAALGSFAMAKIIKRQQLQEIKAAGIEDLAVCPFCYFVAILPQEITVFKCLNPGCMMESCRLCNQLSHVPLKCDELENCDETILKVQIEMQVRKEEENEVEENKEEEEERVPLKCEQCNGEYFQIEDSNQMVCPCGAVICSICHQQFPECPHFNAISKLSRISISSDETDVLINAEDTEDEIVEVNQDPDSLENFLPFLSSESDTY